MSVHVTPAPGEMAKGSWLDTNVFTDIAFETGCGLLQLEERHVFITSISGAVYQVSPAFAMAHKHAESVLSMQCFHRLQSGLWRNSMQQFQPRSCCFVAACMAV